MVKHKEATNLSFTLNLEVNREVKVVFIDKEEKAQTFYFWSESSIIA